MTILTCKYCFCKFIWTRPPGRHGSTPPVVCGKVGDNGLWIITPACKKIRQAIFYQIWKKDHPEKHKANQKNQCKNRKVLAYVAKNVPQPKQYECNHCGKYSSNRFNCPTCLPQLLEGVSEEFPGFIFMDGDADLNDIADTRAACL